MGDQTAISNPVPANTFTCTQCGGELHPDEGQMFVTCPYCNSTVYLDKTQVVFHWYVAPTLDEAKARFALARWMAGNQTVKDLDQKARLTGMTFEYFPLWYFKQRQQNGKEVILLEPAAATSVTELRGIKIPAGDLKRYTPSLDAQAHMPNVPLHAIVQWLGQRSVAANELVERALVHLPIFTFKYTFQGKMYTALVDAASGAVFANLYPAKAEAPYYIAAGVAGGVFLCLATFPVIGAMAGEEYFFVGLLACGGLGLVAAPILTAIAAWVAQKV